MSALLTLPYSCSPQMSQSVFSGKKSQDKIEEGPKIAKESLKKSDNFTGAKTANEKLKEGFLNSLNGRLEAVWN